MLYSEVSKENLNDDIVGSFFIEKLGNDLKNDEPQIASFF